jgi:DNA helicase-2/ATP-dependent DNA helicase PcrA
MLAGQGVEGAGRMENILELKSNLIRYSQEAQDPSIPGFLEEISLYTDLDGYDPGADSMVLMTIHAAKGLEFRAVFVAGMDDGIFPIQRAEDLKSDMEEERRLAYVAVTRAKERLYLTRASSRFLYGQRKYMPQSRFFKEADGDTPAQPRRDFTLESSRVSFTASPSKKTDNRLSVKGTRVKHSKFGEGVIINALGNGDNIMVEVDFKAVGRKTLALAYAPLEVSE